MAARTRPLLFWKWTANEGTSVEPSAFAVVRRVWRKGSLGLRRFGVFTSTGRLAVLHALNDDSGDRPTARALLEGREVTGRGHAVISQVYVGLAAGMSDRNRSTDRRASRKQRVTSCCDYRMPPTRTRRCTPTARLDRETRMFNT